MFQGQRASEDSPLRGALGACDLQQVVVVLQLEVREDQGDGVSRLGQHRPGAVGVIVVLCRVVGRRDGATLTPQGPAAAVVRCGFLVGKEGEGRRFSVKYPTCRIRVSFLSSCVAKSQLLNQTPGGGSLGNVEQLLILSWKPFLKCSCKWDKKIQRNILQLEVKLESIVKSWMNIWTPIL